MPASGVTNFPIITTDITWLWKNYNFENHYGSNKSKPKSNAKDFVINRASSNSPNNNSDVNAARKFASELRFVVFLSVIILKLGQGLVA